MRPLLRCRRQGLHTPSFSLPEVKWTVQQDIPCPWQNYKLECAKHNKGYNIK